MVKEHTEGLRYHELEVLHEIAGRMLQPLGFEEKCGEILQLLVEASQSDAASIQVLSDDGQGLLTIASFFPDRLELNPSDFSECMQGGAVTSSMPESACVVNNCQAGEVVVKPEKSECIRSYAMLPISISGRSAGVMRVASTVKNHFSPERVRLLEAVAGDLSLLLENHRLTQDLHCSTEEGAVVDQVARLMTSTLDVDRACAEVILEVRKLVDFERASISIVEENSDTFTIQYVYGGTWQDHPVGSVHSLVDTMTGEVVKTGKTIISPESSKDSRFRDNVEYARQGLVFCIALPLICKETVIGSMILRSSQPGAFGTREQAILERLAVHIAPVIENARLYVKSNSEKELATRTLAQLKAVLAGVDSGILLVGNNKETLWANHKYGEMFGVGDIDSFARSHPTREDRGKAVYQTLANPEAVFNERTRIYTDPSFAGLTEEVELIFPKRLILQPFTTPVYNDEGDPVGRMWVYHDVTDAKAAEEKLLQLQKMESIGRLAGGIAHDFNNLLTAIMGYSQLATMEASSNGLLVSHVQEIQKAAERAANLTGQLLAFSRRQVIEPKVVDLNNLILDLDSLLGRLIGEDIELLTLPDDSMASQVKVDPIQLEQVLVNLVVNARDAMPSGGKLKIEVSSKSADCRLGHQEEGSRSIPYVVLSVKDTGTGMSEEVKSHLFEPFYTTKAVGKGTGLGLATCYGIIKQSGGDIEVVSELGKGTCVKVYLPRTTELASDFSPSQNWRQHTGGTETILLVEDDVVVRSMVAGVLRDQGYTVLLAGNGTEAINVVQEREGRSIDLLLTDLIMPQMGGLELVGHIRGLMPETGIILTSGYSEDSALVKGAKDSNIQFVQKPFILGELTQKVRDVLDR